MLIYDMDILEEVRDGSLPAGFLALYGTLNRIVFGEQRDALSSPSGDFAFNPSQAYSILPPSLSGITIGAGYNA